MSNHIKSLGTWVAVALVAAAAHAQGSFSEISVQGRSEDGGSQTTIVGSSRYIRFSLTGRRADRGGVVLARASAPLFSASIQDIIDRKAGPLLLDGPVTTLSDGRTRIFVRIDRPDVVTFTGSRVRLFSGTFLFDEDPVIFR